MLGSDLQTLASIANLAKIDLDPKEGRLRLSTSETTGAFSAQYHGVAGSGVVRVTRNELTVSEEIEVDVAALSFLDAVSVFDKNETVSVRPYRGTHLRITNESGSKNLLIKSFDTEGFVSPPDTLVCALKVDRSAFLNEIEIAAEFTAKSTAVSALNGVRLQIVGSEARIMAFNGFSLAYGGKVTGEEHLQNLVVILPVKEAIPCLRVLTGKTIDVLVSQDEDDVSFAGDDGWVRFQRYGLEGWPNLSGLLAPTERQVVTIPADVLQNVLSAVKALDTAPFIQISGRNGKVVLRSDTGEGAGQYVRTIDGELEGSYWYKAEELALVAKLDKDLTLEIATGTAVTLVRGKDRRAWLGPKIR